MPSSTSDRRAAVIHHVDFAVTDFAKSREFYVRALAPLGLTAVMDRNHGDGRQLTGFGELPDPVFWIRNGEPLRGRLHVAFSANTRAAVDAFHTAALAAGGKDKGGPGTRPRYGEHVQRRGALPARPVPLRDRYR